ncbi:MFS transporter [Coriobacteriales bacterium OH1046]|nr:MFS transporter [Coriobacteriales bacterium OH1046]
MAREKTEHPAETPLGGSTWIVIVLLALVGQIAWAVENNFFNLFIQDAFGASLSDVALMVSASAFTATATTLLVGTWSDRVGRRKIFVVAGTLVWGLSICAFAVLQSVSGTLARNAAAAAALGISLTIAFDCLMTFFGSLANDACFNAWLTDITDGTNRGRVEGVNSAMPLLSMLVVFGGALFLMIVGDDGSVTYDYPLFFTIIGGVVIATGIIAAFFMDESHPEPRVGGRYLSELAYGFKPSSMDENRLLYLVLFGYCVFACAMQVFMPYYVLYLRLPYILGESYVLVMAPCIIIASVFTIFYGRLVDKHGFSRSITLPLVLFVAGCILLTTLTSAPAVFIGSMLMLAGYLGSVACFSAAVRNCTPNDHVGLYQGIRIFSVVLVPMLVGPWIGSAVSASSGVVGFGVVGDGFAPSSLIFAAGAAVSLLTFIVTWLIRREERNANA